MSDRKIITVVGARPQFVKAATVSRAFQTHNARCTGVRFDEHIIHTGQHYDANMSKIFFDELSIPLPKVNLEVGSGSQGWQTGMMLQKLEAILLEEKPQGVLIYGDTNSTLAGALAAIKLHIPIAHVEAGLRSFNRLMPEEINRIVADSVSTLRFCPTDTAVANLHREGVDTGVHQVGDVMYDSVLFYSERADERTSILDRLGLTPKQFYLVTVHRGENTDDSVRLHRIIDALGQLNVPIVWPIHPRTRKIMGDAVNTLADHIHVIDPVSYLDMLVLEKHARIILTDSGGVQKEAYWLHVPCITLRDETEWVELVAHGCNQVVGTDVQRIRSAAEKAEQHVNRLDVVYADSLYGDGRSADRIVSILASEWGNQ
jgi:UDP-N-acetylglucosamine 2-epimerase